ncbi:MAG: sulfite exporter TauE/SafE family protein [Sedimentisphaerales bacterium]|nr:sulfite exporter TauE/SafE family protein [Sedimentisphaerales bacterium]
MILALTDTAIAVGAAISLVVGVLTGIFGVGGGFILTPAMIILLAVAPSTAVGTGLATILFTSTLAMWKRRNTNTISFKLAFIISTGSIAGVFIGQWLLGQLNSFTITIAGNEQPAVKYILIWAFLAMSLTITMVVLFDIRHPTREAQRKHAGYLKRFRLGPRVIIPTLDRATLPIIPLVMIGIGIGFMTGLMGIGGGVLLLPILIYLVGLEPVKAAGTSLVLVWISAAVAVGINADNGNIAPKLLIALITGGLIGAYIGTIIGLKLDSHKIRTYFFYVIIASIVLIAYKIIAMTFGLGALAT